MIIYQEEEEEGKKRELNDEASELGPNRKHTKTNQSRPLLPKINRMQIN